MATAYTTGKNDLQAIAHQAMLQHGLLPDEPHLANVQLLAEAFRDEPGRTKYPFGARYIVVPNRLEAYALTAIDSMDRPTNGLRSLAFVSRQRHSCRDA